MKVLGVIIAGGKSSRMGQDKALMEFQGKPLISHVAMRLEPQVHSLALNANGDPARFDFLNLPVFADQVANMGTPLAGLFAALAFAADQGFEAVLTAPCDGPFLPADLRARLEPLMPAIAASGGHQHYLTGLWPVSLRNELDLALAGGIRRAQDFAAAAKVNVVEWPITPRDPFANFNTPGDFAGLSEKP